MNIDRSGIGALSWGGFVVFAIGWLFVTVVGGWVLLDGARYESQPHRPAPVVQVVTLPNGRPVTCVVLEHSVACDFLGFQSGKGG